MIWVDFREKMRGSSNLFEGRRSETNIDQSTSCAVDRQRSAQNQARLPAVLNPKSHHIYRNTSVLCHCLGEVRKTKLGFQPTFNLIFMCSAIV